jgi:ribosomal protein L37AE/L43A
MSERPDRCPFCGNTVLSKGGDELWSCLGALGCGAVWDPSVVAASLPSAARPKKSLRSRRQRRPANPRAHRRALRQRMPLADAWNAVLAGGLA